MLITILTKKYKPAAISLQETLTNDKITSLTGVNRLTQSSPNGTATDGVALFINKGHLFSQVQLDTPFGHRVKNRQTDI